MNVTTIGIELAKNLFQAHGVDGRGKTASRKSIKREVGRLRYPDPSWVRSHQAFSNPGYSAKILGAVCSLNESALRPIVRRNREVSGQRNGRSLARWRSGTDFTSTLKGSTEVRIRNASRTSTARPDPKFKISRPSIFAVASTIADAIESTST
jgi:hypothetical protein